MRIVKFLDQSLNPQKSQHYQIFIQTGPDGFSFCILDKSRNKFIGFKHYALPEHPSRHKLFDIFQEIFKKEEFFKYEYHSAGIIYKSHRTTLLPASLYDRDSLKLFYEFNHQLEKLDELHANYIKIPDVYLLFPVHSDLSNMAIQTFPDIKFYNQASPLINNALSDDPPEGGKGIWASFQQDFFDVVVIDHSKLILHNTFQYRDPKDVLYFILYIYDKLGLSPADQATILLGKVNKNSEMVAFLKKYIRNVRFCKRSKHTEYSHALDPVEEHRFANLFNLVHCG